MNIKQCKLFTFFLFVGICGVKAQVSSDTTLRLILLPNDQILSSKLDVGKTVKEWHKEAGGVYVFVCKNDPDVISKVKKVFAVSAKTDTARIITTDSSTGGMFKPEIDAFLNIEDSSIFSDDKFFDSLNKTDIHPRSYGYYCLIRDIRRVANRVEMLDKLNVKQLDKIKKDMSEIEVFINDYSGDKYKKEKELLSEEQKTYLKNLISKYDKIVENVNNFAKELNK